MLRRALAHKETFATPYVVDPTAMEHTVHNRAPCDTPHCAQTGLLTPRHGSAGLQAYSQCIAPW